MSRAPIQSDVAVIGLGVMGRNLALNLIDKGLNVAGWDADAAWVERNDGLSATPGFRYAKHIEALVEGLKTPRKVLLLVPAGDSVEKALAALASKLQPSDIVIDCGNSHYQDSISRGSRESLQGMHFAGLGVSGGSVGARYGPSMMFGGDHYSWGHVRPILEKIAAQGIDGPCLKRFGDFGAGHFVKMVHNGIEYAEMQLIAEAHDIMSRGMGLSHSEQADFFKRANQGPLQGFLIDLARKVLEPTTTSLDLIIDSAEQKGTGAWSVMAALELGVSIPCIAAAVDARLMSSFWGERQRRASIFGTASADASVSSFTLADLEKAIWFSKICAYMQGFDMLIKASEVYDWSISVRDVCAVWSAGCIIRGAILSICFDGITDAENLDLLSIAKIRQALMDHQDAMRATVRCAVDQAIPTPGLHAAISWFDAFASARMPQAITQAQRDAFGAHGVSLFENPDQKTHGEW